MTEVYEFPNTLEKTFVSVDYGTGKDLSAYVVYTNIDDEYQVRDIYCKNQAGFEIRSIK